MEGASGSSYTSSRGKKQWPRAERPARPRRLSCSVAGRGVGIQGAPEPVSVPHYPQDLTSVADRKTFAFCLHFVFRCLGQVSFSLLVFHM